MFMQIPCQEFCKLEPIDKDFVNLNLSDNSNLLAAKIPQPDNAKSLNDEHT